MTAKAAGFTLIELMVTLGVLSILLLVVVPSFETLVIDSKVDKARHGMASALAFARLEAVKRNETISLCRGSSGACGTSDSGATDWSSVGWQVRTSSEILRTFESDNQGVDIDYDCGNYVSFNGDGERSSSSSSECQFSFADSGGDSSYDKNLWINAVGRARMD